MRSAGPGGRTSVSVPTPPLPFSILPLSLPGLWQLCRPWRTEADTEHNRVFLPLVSLWALPQASRRLPSEFGP